MKFNTTSFLAGVGSVVVVLSTGFAGGYFIANPTRVDPPNRLQRLAAEDHSPPAATAVKPEVVATVTPATAAVPAAPPAATTAPVAAAAQPPAPQSTAQQAATPPAAPPADVKAPEPVRTAAAQETPALATDKPATDKIDTDKASTPKASVDKERAAEAKFAERKRSEARKIAEQQRKQRELDVAAVAVRRIIHGRDAPDVVVRDRDAPDVVIRDRGAPEMVENDPPPEAPGPGMPHFNLFGQ